MAITKKDVFDAIQKLEQDGVNPTNMAIHTITGGSSVTIQKYRKEFFDKRNIELVKETQVLKDTEMQQITETFNMVLKTRIDAVKAGYEKTIRELNESLDDMSNRFEKISAEVISQTKQHGEFRVENDKLKNELDFLKLKHLEEKIELQKRLDEMTEKAYVQQGRADLLDERIKKYEAK